MLLIRKYNGVVHQRAVFDKSLIMHIIHRNYICSFIVLAVMLVERVSFHLYSFRMGTWTCLIPAGHTQFFIDILELENVFVL